MAAGYPEWVERPDSTTAGLGTHGDRPPLRAIRAAWTADRLTVYQAFRPEIAEPAARTGRFGPGFSLDRMTWIKPSFLWMMGRSGWASKPGQERVLAIDIARDGFHWALAHACLSTFDAAVHGTLDAWKRRLDESPVRVQWDPERDITLRALPWRSIQVGLSGEAAARYTREWILAIRDVTALAHAVRDRVAKGDQAGAQSLLPIERPYHAPPEVIEQLGMSPEGPPVGRFPAT
ncbi:MAG: DUF4291 domain-containing protein [Planctomycetes bacterium]|nr:DUF4291 domain-containing protein [Planctomycetota bacterium]